MLRRNEEGKRNTGGSSSSERYSVYALLTTDIQKIMIFHLHL